MDFANLCMWCFNWCFSQLTFWIKNQQISENWINQVVNIQSQWRHGCGLKNLKLWYYVHNGDHDQGKLSVSSNKKWEEKMGVRDNNETSRISYLAKKHHSFVPFIYTSVRLQPSAHSLLVTA